MRRWKRCLRACLIAGFFWVSSVQAAFFPCATVAEKAGKAYQANGAWLAVQQSLETLRSVMEMQGWTLLNQQKGWLILQTGNAEDFFEKCRPKVESFEDQSLIFYPVLKNRSAQRYAVVMPQLWVVSSNESLLRHLPEQAPLKLRFVMSRAHRALYEVVFSDIKQDLDSVIETLSQDAFIEAIYPVLQEPRYHLR